MKFNELLPTSIKREKMATKKMFAVFALVVCIAYFAECGVIETNETGDSGKCDQQLDYQKL